MARMAVTMAEAIRAVREMLDEHSARAWRDLELTRWINEGCKEIAKATESLQESTTITVTSGTRSYDLPDNMIRVTRIDFTPDATNRPVALEYKSFQNPEAVQWAGDTEGMPYCYTTWGRPGSVQLVLYPSPAYDGDLDLYYYRLPIPPPTAADPLDIPEGWENTVYLYAEYVALRRDRQPEWQAAKALFDESLGALYDMTRRHSDQTDSMSIPGPMVNAWLYEMGD